MVRRAPAREIVRTKFSLRKCIRPCWRIHLQTVKSCVEELAVLRGEQTAALCYPYLAAGPRFDIWASIEDVLAMPPKARGEVAEARLVAKLMEMGLTVAKPFGDSAKWDLIVEARGKVSRLQLKSTWIKGGNDYYNVTTGPAKGYRSHRLRPYGADEIDFLVAYIAPEETWFVFPVSVVQTTAVNITMRPNSRFAPYRERWDLLFSFNPTRAKPARSRPLQTSS